MKYILMFFAAMRMASKLASARLDINQERRGMMIDGLGGKGDAEQPELTGNAADGVAPHTV